MRTYGNFQILTVYETNISELCQEVIRQMACKNVTIVDLNEDPSTYITRKRQRNYFLPCKK